VRLHRVFGARRGLLVALGLQGAAGQGPCWRLPTCIGRKGAAWHTRQRGEAISFRLGIVSRMSVITSAAGLHA
jgi:hypothetical protein